MCRCGPDSPGLRTFVDEPRGGETTPDRGTTPVGQVQVLPSQRSIRRKRLEFSVFSLLAAIRQYSRSISTPMLFRPFFRAATIVVPEPQKGSRTVSPEKENMRTNRVASSSGNGAGWLRRETRRCQGETRRCQVHFREEIRVHPVRIRVAKAVCSRQFPPRIRVRGDEVFS